MTEADVQSKFTRWIRENKYDHSAAWELKLCKGGKALPFSAFQPQQLPSLLKAKQACIYRKLSDFDPGLKPFDAMQVCHSEAYVVACWHHEGKGVTAYWIDIEKFLEAQKLSTRKSMTEQTAERIASKIIKL